MDPSESSPWPLVPFIHFLLGTEEAEATTSPPRR